MKLELNYQRINVQKFELDSLRLKSTPRIAYILELATLNAQDLQKKS